MILFEVRTSDDGTVWKARGSFVDMCEAVELKYKLGRALNKGQKICIVAMEYPKNPDEDIHIVWQSKELEA